MSNLPERLRMILLTFPPRPLASYEHAILAEWLSLVGDGASATVDERRSDDPTTYRRIVISAGSDGLRSHLVHAPTGMTCWLVNTVGVHSHVHVFDSLRDALNSIRPVLA